MDGNSCFSDKFKEQFKYFKSKNPKPDFSEVVDFDQANNNHAKGYSVKLQDRGENSATAISNPCEECEKLGLQDHRKWEIFSLESKPGFLFIKNPFETFGQQKWIRNCLEIYSKKPNRTNLDAHHENIDEVWPTQWSTDESEKSLLWKLRWSTLGYHHNWNTKVYCLNDYSAFPLCLSQLCKHTATVLGFSKFHPEAAIINYYQLNSSLGGHVDCSEYDHETPILSFSFGQTAVFLIGTENKHDRPVPLFIRSGDIIIMSGVCRLAYHGMPLVVKDSVDERYTCSPFDDTWTPFANYLRTSRININVRQVLPCS